MYQRSCAESAQMRLESKAWPVRAKQTWRPAQIKRCNREDCSRTKATTATQVTPDLGYVLAGYFQDFGQGLGVQTGHRCCAIADVVANWYADVTNPLCTSISIGRCWAVCLFELRAFRITQ
jgi:hypothetical protein